MRLRWSKGSPFTRKVLVAAHECQLAGRIEIIPTDFDDPASGLWDENPLGRIPTLVLDDETVITGSSLICAWLDEQHDGPRLIPASGPAKWDVLHREILADGLCESAIAIQREFARPQEKHWPDWVARQRGEIERTIKWFAENEPSDTGNLTLDQIALACTLGWIDFRLSEQLGGWHGRHGGLSDWLAAFSERQSMKETAPGK